MCYNQLKIKHYWENNVVAHSKILKHYANVRVLYAQPSTAYELVEPTRRPRALQSIFYTNKVAMRSHSVWRDK